MLDGLVDRRPPNAKSLIVSVFGDAILPHGGTIWLGSLSDLVAPFGLNDRVVRTSVFRLSKEGWLGSTQFGRRSAYSLTESGRGRFEAAHRAIYAGAAAPWGERWTLVFTGLVDGAARESLRDDLVWQGFGQLLPGLMLHPAPDESGLRQTLAASNLAEEVVVMAGSGEGWTSPEQLRRIAAKAWNLDALAAVYTEFLADFRPFLPVVEDEALDPAGAFRLRTLLIHAWRRAILRDPLLPEELLPADWPGAAARLLCSNLYRAIAGRAEQHLRARMETPDGLVGPPHPAYFDRFGGL